MNDLWRTSNSRLVAEVINAESETQCLALKPDNIKSVDEWKDFVRAKKSKEHLVSKIVFLTSLLLNIILIFTNIDNITLSFFGSRI